MKTLTGLAVFGGFALMACATAKSAATRREACQLSPTDSVYLIGGPVYRECGVDSKAKAVGTFRLDYQPPRPMNNCSVVELELVVDALGQVEPGTTRVVRSNDRGFADAVRAALVNVHFEPASLDKESVRQIVPIKFTLSGAGVGTNGRLPVGRGQRASIC